MYDVNIYVIFHGAKNYSQQGNHYKLHAGLGLSISASKRIGLATPYYKQFDTTSGPLVSRVLRISVTFDLPHSHELLYSLSMGNDMQNA